MKFARISGGFGLLFGLIFLYPGGVLAQLPGDAAGPRAGTVYVLEVSLPDATAIGVLDAAGFNIDDVRDGTAQVYATPAERLWLDDRGFRYRVLEEQPPPVSKVKVLGTYHTHAELTAELQAYAAAFPAITRLFSLGDSVQGRELWALLITDNPDVEEDEPEFKYVSTMHGDEPVGTEMCLFLIDLLLNDYGVAPRITSLVDETAIWIVPMMNPDGVEVGVRQNANGFDLNRSFPAFPTDFMGTIFEGESLDDAGREPEVVHILQWSAQHSFVLAANLHTGALVVNYPYDHEPGIPSGVDAPTPDDLLMEDLALRYSTPNMPMFDSPIFEDGITNGSAWFSIIGGMQDWNYRYAGCIEFTLELSDVKTPPEGQLPGFWTDNEESMLAYMEAAHIGIRGIVTDQDTGLPVYARILVDANPQPVFTDPDVGDYHRLLLPGTYTIAVSAPGYETATIPGVLVVNGPATRVDVALTALDIPAGTPLTRILLVTLIVTLAGFFSYRKTGTGT